MTIAAGFRCPDGVVICTDSQHTAGQSKFFKKKIFEAKAENATVYLAGAGSDEHIRKVADEIKDDIASKVVSLDRIKAKIEAVTRTLYQQNVVPSRQANDPNSPTLSLLVAAKIKPYGLKRETADALLREHGGDSADPSFKMEIERLVANYRPGEPTAKLFRVQETGVLSEIDDRVCTGSEVAESLCREATELLYNGLLSVFSMRIIAAQIIRRTCSLSTFCGGAVQVACLADCGMEYFSDFSDYSSESEPTSMLGFLRRLPDLMESCLDPSIPEHVLSDHLKLFAEDIEQLRKERASSVGEHHPSETDGWLR
jgi:hypothetical protein